MNITLSHDNRTLLLNDAPMHPLVTIPTPPTFYAAQYRPEFSNNNLSHGLSCSNPYCRPDIHDSACSEWCWDLPLSTNGVDSFYTSSIKADYLYTMSPVEGNGEEDTGLKYWELSLDILGGSTNLDTSIHWKFDDAKQTTLRMTIAGKELTKGGRDKKTASDLFGESGDEEKSYKYSIVDVNLWPRKYDYPTIKTITLWSKIGRFFGTDVWEEEGRRFIYRDEEWGSYGKKGTLRNTFGNFVHWELWYMFWIIFSSVVGGILALFGLYKLFFWLVQQRELAHWDGIDDMWDSMRRQRTLEEEEDALLDSGYRDDPDEGRSSESPRYVDEPRTMKPLPSKPLPDKPLPAVPLIDA